MSRHVRVVSLVAGLLLAANASASDAVEAAESPLAAVDGLFEAMAVHDTHRARQLILPGAQFVVVRPDGTSALRDDAGFIESLAQRPESVLRERMWNHQVLVDGPMAQVWGPYDFHIDGTRNPDGSGPCDFLEATSDRMFETIGAVEVGGDECDDAGHNAGNHEGHEKLLLQAAGSGRVFHHTPTIRKEESMNQKAMDGSCRRP